LIKTIDFTTAGYLATNPTFPHESTIDQFFNPDQFDAYRYLGYDAAISMINALELVTSIDDPSSLAKSPSSKPAPALRTADAE
jgi:hypothetical protein